MRGENSSVFRPPKSWNGSSTLYRLDAGKIGQIRNPQAVPGEEKNFILHFDSATGYVHPEVVAWLQEQKVEFITKEEWMANSPDLSSLDYAVNGIFEDQCRREEAYDVDQLVAIADRVWKKFGLGSIQRALGSWPSRVKKVIEASGWQIENIL